MSHLVHRRLRAPQEDGAALIDPPLRDVPGIIHENRAKQTAWDQQAGAPITKWREEARQAMTAVCKAQARRAPRLEHQTPAQKPPIPASQRAFILSGHQPTLFHPGVWLKNFLLSEIREQVYGTAINLIIDNDVCTSTTIAVPSGYRSDPRIAHVPYDEPPGGIPWEELTIRNIDLFSSFADRVKAAFTYRDPNAGPLILDHLWEQTSASIRSQLEMWRAEDASGPLARMLLNIGECIAGGRHQLERELGLMTHEIPLSGICNGPAFLRFADHIFCRAREFREVYNAAVHEFRQVNRVRSDRHPVPELEMDGPWTEVPFWIWSLRQVRRRRAFVRELDSGWEVSDREDTVIHRGWNDHETPFIQPSLRLRPRALITTMYARLVLSDLFIHGIGGAKYDELTDLIIRRFFGIEPPAYMTATATFRLPIERPHVTLDDVRESARRLRELRYRPESFVRDERVRRETDLSTKLSALAQEKREYLAAHDLRRCSQDVFDHLDRLNRAMHDLLRPVEGELRARHVELIALAKQSQLLASREFSFVLFPAEKLPAQLLALSKVVA